MLTRRHLLLASLLAGFGLLSLEASLTPVSAAEKKARMLMVTQSKGFKHGAVNRPKDELAPSEVALTQLGQQSGLFTVDCTQDVAKDFTIENLKNYDIVFFYTTGDLGLSKEVQDFFFDTWLKQKGHGFVGAHSATDTYGNNQRYWDMVGGTFNGHPWGSGETVTISVHDAKHPSTKSLGSEFEFKDEIYQYKNWQPEKVRVLMSLNMAKSKIKKPYHVPVAWVKTYGDGKVFYTNLGHNNQTWTSKIFQDHMLGGIKWIMGLEEGDATPNPDVSKDQEAKAKSDTESAGK